MRSRRVVLSFVAFSCLLVGGCHADRRETPKNLSSLKAVDISNNAAPTLILLADAQINENHGLPTFWESKVTQTLLHQTVARRSVQQTVFSDALLSQTIRRAEAGRQVPVVFLGDAMNMSCTSEYARFLEAMKAGNANWVALPGNHDGFYSGVTQPTNEERHGGTINWISDRRYGRDRDVWEVACRKKEVMVKSVESGTSGKGGLQKGVVETYAENVLERFPGSLAGSQPTSEGCYERRWKSGTLRNLAWCSTNGIHGTRPPWQAFVIQKVVAETPTGEVDVILLDSSVYGGEPCVFPRHCSDVGLSGGLGTEQKKIAQLWLDESSSAGHVVVIMAHHPISAWDDDSSDKSWLEGNVASGKISLAVTAHTHNGCVRDPLRGALSAFRELNISSIIDEPISFTRLWLMPDAGTLDAGYTFVPISQSLLGVQGTDSCLEFDDDDSIATQAEGLGTGPYENQLSQIRAELRLAQRTLAHASTRGTDESQALQKSLSSELLRVRSAEDSARRHCSHLFSQRALDCERDHPVESLVPPKTIRQVAIEAQDRLISVETSATWKAMMISPDGSAYAACVAAVTTTPYWTAVTFPHETVRSPLGECLKPH